MSATLIVDPQETESGNHFDGSEVGLANHGDHITIGIKPHPTNDVKMMVHLTTYIENTVDFSYTRDTLECNVLLLQNGNVLPVTKESVCVPPRNAVRTIPLTVGSVYGGMGDVLQIIDQMGRIAHGHQLGGDTRYAVFHGRRYRIREGKRGGHFILANGERKYLRTPQRLRLQMGGSPLDYKGVHFDDIIAFLGARFIDPVFASANGPMENAIVLFDEASQLGQNTNAHILFMYDAKDGYRRIFYVDSRLALMAFFAWTNATTASADEHSALESLEAIAVQTVTRMVSVSA